MSGVMIAFVDRYFGLRWGPTMLVLSLARVVLIAFFYLGARAFVGAGGGRRRWYRVVRLWFWATRMPR